MIRVEETLSLVLMQRFLALQANLDQLLVPHLPDLVQHVSIPIVVHLIINYKFREVKPTADLGNKAYVNL